HLQPYNLPPYTLFLIIHIQQPNTAPWLPPPISRAPRIEEQLPPVLLIIRNVTVSEDHTAGGRKLLSCQSHPVARVSQNMHNPNPTISHHHFALNRQLQHHFFVLNIALNR